MRNVQMRLSAEALQRELGKSEDQCANGARDRVDGAHEIAILENLDEDGWNPAGADG